MEAGNMVLAALGIGLLIFIHELGHFLAARAAGVRVEVFSLGFGPRLCGVDLGGTDFRLSLVPFGGFVMVAGQDPADRRYPARMSLYAKSIGQRALFWSGGVLMNVLFALVVFPLVFRAGVKFVAPIVGTVAHGSAAWEVDIAPGDRITAVQGKPVFSLDNLSVEIALHGQRAIELTVERGGAARTVTATPQFDAESGLYQLGIGAAYGDMVLDVVAGGPAAAAGLRTGDVLLRANGAAGSAGARAIAEASQSGAALELTVRREALEVAGTVAGRPATVSPRQLIGVVPCPRQIRGIRLGSAFVDGLGLRRGDVICSIDGLPFLGGDLARFATGPDVLRLELGRQGQPVRIERPATPAQRAELAAFVALADDGGLRLQPTPGGAAHAAGLLPGDLLHSIDGRELRDWADLKQAVAAAAGKTLHLRVSRLPADRTAAFDAARGDLPLGETVELAVAPRHEALFDHGFEASAPLLQEEVRADSFAAALRLGTVCSFDLVKQFYVTLKRLVTGDVGAKNLGGIIRISQVSYHAAARGPSWFWYFLALLSVNLAFVNLLPVPVLDGGHLLFLLIEKVKGSPVSARVFGYSQVVGLLFVLLLVLFVTYNDILRLL